MAFTEKKKKKNDNEAKRSEAKRIKQTVKKNLDYDFFPRNSKNVLKEKDPIR